MWCNVVGVVRVMWCYRWGGTPVWCGTTGSRNFHKKSGTSTTKKEEFPQQKSGTSTTVDFLHFLVIKSKKFRHIRVPHIEKSLDTKNQLEIFF